MNKKFQKRYLRLQDLLSEYVKELNDLSHEDLNKSPGENSWSVAEVVYHISHAEKAIVQYIQKKLIKPEEAKRAGLKSMYKAILLRLALRSSRKFRAPKVLDNPQGPYEKDQLISEWKIIRATLGNTYDSVSQDHLGRQLFKHPVVGKINLYQTLGFMGDHMQRHLKQIRKIKKELNGSIG